MRSLPSLRRLSGPHPYLYNFDIPWHQLTHLHMGGIHTKGTAHSNLRILSQCPALLLCSLSLDSDDGPSSTSSSEVVLSYLESLSLSVLRCNVPGPASQLFSSLTLPALRVLAVAGSGPSPGVIESFLKRSACPLTTLRLARNAMSSADLMQWLRPVTATMDSLSLFVNIHPADDILYALTCNEKETCLCPNLRSIEFWGWSWASGLMADMIESRRRDTSSLLQEVDIAMDFQSCLDDVPRLRRLTNLGLKVKC
ncbi:hypothetical protein C8J57DRAFT_1041866 [Mycena rebaudengoi]|nr:hypothetical protein C8J57DRAFT_1041866 [Mycena rebaudengoi]